MSSGGRGWLRPGGAGIDPGAAARGGRAGLPVARHAGQPGCGLACAGWGWPSRVLALSAYSDDAAIHGMVEAGGGLLQGEGRRLPSSRPCGPRAEHGEGRWSRRRSASRLAAWAIRPAASAAGTGLTSRELEVVRWLAKGWDDRRIAQELHISEHTVRFHLRNIRDKIGVQTRTEAAVWAIRRGLAED